MPLRKNSRLQDRMEDQGVDRLSSIVWADNF